MNPEGSEIEQIVSIQNLVSEIAHVVDFGTLEEHAALLSPDITWEFPGTHEGIGLGVQVRRGHDDAIEGARERRAAGIQGPGTHTRHVVNSTAVTAQPHAPTSLTYWHYYKQTHLSPVLTRWACTWMSSLAMTPAAGCSAHARSSSTEENACPTTR